MSLVEFYGSRLRLRDLVQFGIVLKIQKRYEVQQNFINPINDCLVKMTQDILKRIFLGDTLYISAIKDSCSQLMPFFRDVLEFIWVSSIRGTSNSTWPGKDWLTDWQTLAILSQSDPDSAQYTQIFFWHLHLESDHSLPIATVSAMAIINLSFQTNWLKIISINQIRLIINCWKWWLE